MISFLKTSLLFCCLLCGANSFGQVTASSAEQVSGIRPGPASSPQLSSSSLYNVNLYTGTANVTIPIYDCEVDNLDLGISLNYNTKGIKVDQLASSEGLGWDLTAGGSIVRQVSDIEDEITVPSLNPFTYSQWVTGPVLPRRKGYWTNFGTDPNDMRTEKEHITNADVFTATFAGRTIKFMIDFGIEDAGFTHGSTSNQNSGGQPSQGSNSEWYPYKVYTYPKSEVRIKLLVDGVSYTDNNSNDHWLSKYLHLGLSATGPALQFVIVDEKGNEFTFDRGDYEHKTVKSTQTTTTATYYPTSQWVLKKVKTYTGKVIEYEYYTPQFVSYPASKLQTVKETFIHNATASNNGTITFPGGAFVENTTVFWTGAITHLKSIAYPNGVKAHFNLSNTGRCDVLGLKPLDNIVIESKYDNLVKNSITYKFNYAYFLQPNNSSNDHEASISSSCNDITATYNLPPHGTFLRLKLKSIDRIGTDLNNNERYYTFDYSDLRLPERLSPAQDLYGYYNGAVSVSLQGHALGIPYHTNTIICLSGGMPVPMQLAYGVSKGFDAYHAQACILKKVTNGLGGSVGLFYSDASNSVSFNVTDGYWYKEAGNPFWVNGAIDDTYLTGTDIMDGLVVSRVDVLDGYNLDNKVSTFYNYAQGERFFPGGYFFDNTIRPFQTYSGFESNNNYLQKTWYNTMLNSWDYPFGSNHGFKEVTVTSNNAMGHQISKSRHTFSGISTSFWNDNLPWQNLIVNTGWGYHSAKQSRIFTEFLGLPLETITYDNIAGNTAHIVSKVENEYSSSLAKSEQGGGMNGHNYNYVFKVPCQSVNGCFDGYNSETFGYFFAQLPLLETYPFQPNKSLLKKTTTTTYSNGQAMSTFMDYSYDSKDNVVSIKWNDSRGIEYEKLYGYTYSGFPNTLKQHVWSTRIFEKSGSTYHIIDEKISDYYNIEVNPRAPNFTSLSALSQPGGWTSNGSNIRKTYLYDVNLNAKQTESALYPNGANPQLSYSSAIWDLRVGRKVADVSNAKFSQIAYSSFEGPFANKGVSDANKGNFDFEPSSIIVGGQSDKAVTGRYYYLLKPNGSLNFDIVSQNAPENNKPYLLTFWAKQSGFVINLGSQNISSQAAAITTVNGWTLYVCELTGNGSGLAIASSGPEIKIDEVRLHPADAEMSTFTYEPLLGISSSCDVRNNITYQEYDLQGRPWIVKDINGNILSLTKTVNQGDNN